MGIGYSSAGLGGNNLDLIPAAPGTTVALLGTSITDANKPYDQGGGTMSNHGAGYFHWANALLRQSATLILEAGVSGDTTGQMLARVQDVIDAEPFMCVVETGPNDVQGDSTFENITGALIDIYEALTEAGTLVFATHIYPTTTITAELSRVALMHRMNRWIDSYASAHAGVVSVPWAGVVTNPSTGAALSGALHDGVHPSTYGAALLGRVLADVMEPYVKECTDLPISNADTSNFCNNGMMLGGTTTAAGWTASTPDAGSYVAAKVARQDGDPGEWQQLAIASGTAELLSTAVTSGVSVGDVVAAEIEFDGDATNASRLEVQVQAVDGSNNVLGAALGLSDYYSSTSRIPMSRAVLRSHPLTVPSGATGLRLLFIAAGSLTARVSRASIRKVTV
jgi:lysophospholipase L1-like esterase